MPSSPVVDIIIVHDPVKVWATTSPPAASQPPIPLTPHSSTPCSWAYTCSHTLTHALTVSCAMHVTGGPRSLVLPPCLIFRSWFTASCSLKSSRSLLSTSTIGIAVPSDVLRKCTQGSGSGV